eukprot:6068778-Ditylum_brightwellii.AAC.1
MAFTAKTLIKLRGKFNGDKSNCKEEEQALLDQVTKIESKYNDNGKRKKVELEDLITVVVSVAPTKYQSNLALEQGNNISEDNDDREVEVLDGFERSRH